jgi:hypothetical protein
VFTSLRLHKLGILHSNNKIPEPNLTRRFKNSKSAKETRIKYYKIIMDRTLLRQKLRNKILNSRNGNCNINYAVTQQQDKVQEFRRQGEHGAKMRIKP